MAKTPSPIVSAGTHRGIDWFTSYSSSCGHRTGYILLDNNHPWFGLDFNQEKIIEIDVHGGITYASDTLPWREKTKNASCWILGFDCGHAHDGIDFDLIDDQFSGVRDILKQLPRKGVVRDLNFVQQQCSLLADQAADAMHSSTTNLTSTQ